MAGVLDMAVGHRAREFDLYYPTEMCHYTPSEDRLNPAKLKAGCQYVLIVSAKQNQIKGV